MNCMVSLHVISKEAPLTLKAVHGNIIIVPIIIAMYNIRHNNIIIFCFKMLHACLYNIIILIL